MAVLATFVALLLTRHIFKSDLDISSVDLSVQSNVCTVALRVTNKAREPVTAELQIIVEHGWPGTPKSPPDSREVARAPLTISLKPGEQKSYSCKLPLASSSFQPNTTRIQVISYHKHR